MKKFFNNLIIVLGLGLFIFFFDANTPFASDTLKFVQLSDTHITSTRKDTSYKLLADSKPLLCDAISRINQIDGIDFVMVTGDGIDVPLQESLNEYIDLMNVAKYPWYHALGNHDTTTDGTLKKNRFLAVLKEKNSHFKFDNLYYSFEPKAGYKVIVMDGAKTKGISSNGNIPQEQLDWLDSELKDAKTKKEIALIFLHFPLKEPFPSAHHRILNADEFNNVLSKYSFPIAIFAGHYHTTKIVKAGNILHVASPSLVSYPNAFRVVTVSNEKNRVVFDFKLEETGLKELQEKAKLMTLGSSSYYGEDKDRETTVIIDK